MKLGFAEQEVLRKTLVEFTPTVLIRFCECKTVGVMHSNNLRRALHSVSYELIK